VNRDHVHMLIGIPPLIGSPSTDPWPVMARMMALGNPAHANFPSSAFEVDSG
jgi:REP element-mobilizing transposase RayT